MISLFFKQVLALVKLNIKHDLMNSRLSFILHLIFSVLVSAASLHASKCMIFVYFSMPEYEYCFSSSCL